MKYLFAFIGAFTIGVMYNSLSVVEQVNILENNSKLVCVKPVASFECDRDGKCVQVATVGLNCNYR